MSHGLKFHSRKAAENHLVLINPKLSERLTIQMSFAAKNPFPFQIVPKREALRTRTEKSGHAERSRRNLLTRRFR